MIMETNPVLEILKQAILLEKRGFSFYSTVARQTSDPDIHKIFQVMADEETLHVKFLSDQFAHYDKNKSFLKTDLPDFTNDGIARLVLTEEVKRKITAAGFEAAAISAAIDMEKRAIEIYSAQTLQATDPAEKELYAWLADWEKTHLKVLSELDNELKEKIWFDNQFWPF
jgi:rubrerythrin